MPEKNNDKINLLDLTYSGLKRLLQEKFGQSAFRTDQVFQWVWQKMARDFEEMSNISKELRQILKENLAIKWPEIADMQKSRDGTVKFLLRLGDGKQIETVLIPAENRSGQIRWAQCLSSQAGCPMACGFCATGQMGFQRNLSMGEILGQILIGRDYLNDRRMDRPILRNVVFMGMGEPLLNMDALLPALRTMAHDKGLNFSPRRITVSTSGIKDGLARLGESGLTYLAVSLHAPSQELRQKIMPAAASWPLDEMIASLKNYPVKARERITFEYLLLGGVNDSRQHAKELVRLLSQIPAKINLINFNPVPGLPYKSSDPQTAQAFQDYLCEKRVTAILRKSKGADIAAACGQLRAQNLAAQKKPLA